jgi:hypothetical protein
MSRPRSGRSSAPAARGGRPGVFVQAPKSDIYVVMLSVALGAMFLGSLLLVLILARYDFKVKVSANPPAAPAVGLAQLENPENLSGVRL